MQKARASSISSELRTLRPSLSPVLATRRVINHTFGGAPGSRLLAPSVRRLPSASVRRCAEGRLSRNHVGECVRELEATGHWPGVLVVHTPARARGQPRVRRARLDQRAADHVQARAGKRAHATPRTVRFGLARHLIFFLTVTHPSFPTMFAPRLSSVSTHPSTPNPDGIKIRARMMMDLFQPLATSLATSINCSNLLRYPIAVSVSIHTLVVATFAECQQRLWQPFCVAPHP